MTESSFNSDKYNSEFAVKLRDEFLKTPDDVKGLAQHLGCSVQAITQYKLGQALPKVENLIKIARYFNCSLDYLIGISDVKTPDTSIKTACEHTGLSEESICFLRGLDKECLKVINLLFDDTQKDNYDYWDRLQAYLFTDGGGFTLNLKTGSFSISRDDVLSALLMMNDSYLKKLKDKLQKEGDK